MQRVTICNAIENPSSTSLSYAGGTPIVSDGDTRMLDQDVLTAALGLTSPWHLNSAEACPASGLLHIGLAYPEHSTFACPHCGASDCPAELSWPRIWHQPRFFGYQAYVLTRLPDLGCDRCGIVPAAASWEASGFTLLTLNLARPGLAQWCASGPWLDVSAGSLIHPTGVPLAPGNPRQDRN
jgi:hypothetical protein